MDLILGSLLILVFYGGLAVAIWLAIRAFIVTPLANRDLLFTSRKEGHIKYLMELDRLIAYVYKIEGHWIDQNTGDIIPVGKKKDSTGNFVDDPTVKGQPDRYLSEIIFGAYWIGWRPRRIKRYPFYYMRSQRPGDKKLASTDDEHYKLLEHNIVERYTETTYHAWRQTYSILIEDIEVKGFEIDNINGQKIEGQAQVDVWGTLTILTTNARIPVLELEGDWFSLVRDGVSGAVSDFLSDKDLDEVRKIKKVQTQPGGAPSVFEQEVINASKGQSGTKATAGLEIEAFNTAGIEVEDKAEEVLRDRGIAKVKADTRKIEGKGEGDYRREVGEGIAAADEAQVKAIKGNRIAAGVLEARARADGMRDARLTGVYVEGGGSPPLLSVPARAAEPPPAQPVAVPVAVPVAQPAPGQPAAQPVVVPVAVPPAQPAGQPQPANPQNQRNQQRNQPRNPRPQRQQNNQGGQGKKKKKNKRQTGP